MEDHVLGLIRRFNLDYVEFRHEETHSTSINLKDSETSVSSGSNHGICARVLVHGSWGMASSDNPGDIETVFKKAFRMAGISRGATEVHRCSYSGESKTNAKVWPSDVSIEQKVSDMKEIKGMLSGKGISNRSVRYLDLTSSKLFINSEGSRIRQMTSRVYLSFSSIARKGSIMEQASGRVGQTSGYESVRQGFEMASDCPRRALALLSARTPSPGRYQVIVDGRMAGLLCHEALGHACEADGVMAGSSILKSSMGQRIASPLVSIYDDPTLPGALGSYSFDDEGVRTSKTTLVSRGKLKSFLHSRETAERFGSKPMGNARAQNCSYVPQVRMSNTYMGGGESKVDELFEGVGTGIYALGMSGGCVDTTTGYFVFSAEEGFLIRNGRKTKLLRDVLLSGNILDSLKNVDMVADDFSGSPGICGKMGQAVPVSDGGPHIRIKDLLVGGQKH